MGTSKSPPLYLPFFLALFPTLFGKAIIPSLNLVSFAPFLVLSFYYRTFPQTLWFSMGCGLILDLLSSELLFGTQALLYTATTTLLYRRKLDFFADNITTIPVLTAIYSCCYTLLSALACSMLSKPLILSFNWMVTDLFLLSLIDGLYAFMWFTVPLYYLLKKPKQIEGYSQERPQ